MHPGRHAQTDPHKVAHVMAPSGAAVTYRELDQRANRLAQFMWDAGLRRGDHVALFVENHPRYFEVYWAAMRSGLYLTPINHHLSAAEAAYIVDDCRADVLVTSFALGDVAEDMVRLIPPRAHRLMVDGVRPGYESYEAALAGSRAEPLAVQPFGEVLLYSSGTTGRPKGIWRPLPERTFDDDSPPSASSGLFSMSPQTVFLQPGPLYHATLGYATGVQTLGGTVVVMERFDARAALDAIEAHRVTHSHWVPTMFTRMLRLDDEERGGRDLSSHTVALHGAAPCPVQVKRDMIRWWGPILVEYYGATERNGMTVIRSDEWQRHEGSVGPPVIGTIHICDDDGRELPTGTDGLVYFERESIPFQYHNDDGKTRSAQHAEHETWSTLGDIGHVDDDGYLYLTDRQSFMIISGGVNIYPAESENVLGGHPKVLDVAVIGVPNAEYGEEVKAIVQVAKGVAPSQELADELIAFCRDHLAHFKCPRSVDFVAEVPRLATGKLDKRTLREQYGAAVAR